MHLFWRFLIALLLCFTLASVAHTQFVLAKLAGTGVVIPWSERVSMSLQDWWGLLPTYGAIIAVGLLLAFAVTGFLLKHYRSLSGWLYPLAGLVAILTIHLAMQPIMDITLIAGARTHLGLASQAMAGFVAGWVFYGLRHKPRMHFS
ncbi:hypothetical protein [Bowmanella dokdonensis]|uniref:Uncharacterized protein n=1 Tax=Bowmanella dokdonensis TaxID=751969 RepID=A0A939IPW8_9ALTE|nr:hypothetical protein [Bowmanella dokdonensis]MBN7826305.1 hypothetical protein [Bowmanella dokdonensis]